MQAEPQDEHRWLQKLVGEWTSEGECGMGPDQPVMKTTGTESVRSIGGLWVVSEGKGEMPGGGPATAIITLGYDPQAGRFVGTFIGSMMTYLWKYEGTLKGDVLTLAAEGPSFTEPGKMAKYHDIIAFKSDDHRVMTSHVQGDDGQWTQIMTTDLRRKK